MKFVLQSCAFSYPWIFSLQDLANLAPRKPDWLVDPLVFEVLYCMCVLCQERYIYLRYILYGCLVWIVQSWFPEKKKIVLAVTIVQVNDIVMFVCCFVYFALSNHNLLLGKWCLYFSTWIDCFLASYRERQIHTPVHVYIVQYWLSSVSLHMVCKNYKTLEKLVSLNCFLFSGTWSVTLQRNLKS